MPLREIYGSNQLFTSHPLPLHPDQILDLSDCQLDDEALIRIMPVFGHLEELFLSDNSFTWYGIR